MTPSAQAYLDFVDDPVRSPTHARGGGVLTVGHHAFELKAAAATVSSKNASGAAEVCR